MAILLYYKCPTARDGNDPDRDPTIESDPIRPADRSLFGRSAARIDPFDPIRGKDRSDRDPDRDPRVIFFSLLSEKIMVFFSRFERQNATAAA